MKILKTFGIIISAAAAILLVTLLFFMLTEYRPAGSEDITPYKTASNTQAPGGLRLISWNLGYCGLDESKDFFMEGGQMKDRGPLKDQQAALDSIIEAMKKEEADVYFLQEVDRAAKRSYGVDQFHAAASSFEQYGSYHALNFKSPFVPSRRSPRLER